MEQHGVSGLPLVDAAGKIAGVITRTDLLQAGEFRWVEGAVTAHLPAAPAKAHATSQLEAVELGTPLHECARRMVKGHIHRLYVLDGERLVGVVSTLEMMRAVASGHVAKPLADVMTDKIVAVRAEDPLALAIDRLRLAHRSGLVVTDQGWPVGIFSQQEALRSADCPASEPVGGWMDEHVVCLPSVLGVSRAAAQAVALGVRRIVVLSEGRAVGIVSGLDFARLIRAAGS